ncbi:MFS general substrate transporter [Rhizodiscina lignyota]|uniref:MFS general substrate transporter n=1 Tax=Rhizodiscina lignyota TaxID=1504668 RepID=A0A9P4IBN5_9PEZI|nr:MFS general substrate transporter [Rhizodiscina lignyota]
MGTQRALHRVKERLEWLLDECGLYAVVNAGPDIHLLILSRVNRMLSFGATALVLALYLNELGFSDEWTGLLFSLTLLGDVVLSLLMTMAADHFGRRRTLVLTSALAILSSVVFAISGNYYILLLAAILGVISPSGTEIGPDRAIEESIIAQLAEENRRTDLYTWYNTLSMLGAALGIAVSGLMVGFVREKLGGTAIQAYRSIFWLNAILAFIKAILALLLSKRCERPAEDCTPASTSENGIIAESPTREIDETEPLLQQVGRTSEPCNGPDLPQVELQPKNHWSRLWPFSKDSTLTILLLCGLFSLDSFASGLVPYSLINLYLERKFSIPEKTLGGIMSGSLLLCVPFNLLAPAIAKRIGNVKTMVFGHLPAAVLLSLVPAPSSPFLTFAIIYARQSVNSMDQAPRSAFVSAVVLPEERTAVMGLSNVLKTFSQSFGPGISGVLAGRKLFWVAFVLAGALKALYDVGLLAMFEYAKLHNRKKAYNGAIPDEEVSVETSRQEEA